MPGRAAADLALGRRPRAARGRGSPAAAPGARRGRPGRGRGGRRRGRRRAAAAARAARAARTDAEQLGDVAHAGRRTRCASAVPSSSPYSFIAEPQPAALTTMWSSSPSAAERRDRGAGAGDRRLLLAARAARARRSSRAAAARAPRSPRRRARRSSPRWTSAKNTRWTQPSSSADPAALLADRRRALGEPVRSASRARRARRDLAPASPSRPGSRSTPSLRAAAEQRRERAQPLGVGERLEQQPAQRPLGARALVMALDLRPDPLDQAVVAHARGAGGHARHAAEAAVEVRDHLVGQLGRAVERPRRSARSARAASRPPAPTARTSGSCPGRSRSGRSRRSTDCSGGRWASNAGTSDPAHEHARVARAGRVEALLDAAHQLERRPSPALPTGSSARAASAGASSSTVDRARGQRGAQLRRARSGSSSTKLEAERGAPDQRRRRSPATASQHRRRARWGGRRPAPARRSRERWPARWRAHSAASSSMTSTSLEPGAAHQPGDPLRPARRLARRRTGRARRRGPPRQATSSASSSSGAAASAAPRPRAAPRVGASRRARSRSRRAAGAGAR